MKNKKMIVLAVVLIAIAGGLVWYYTAGQVAAVEVVAVTKGDIARYVEDTASVKCHRTETVFAEGTGRVTEIKAAAGDRVKAGDLLAVIDKTSAELQLKDADAKINAAEAQLKGTDIKNYANRIEIAKAAVNQSQIAYDSALRTYNSVKQLYEENSSSKDDLDRAQDACKATEQTLTSSHKELEDVRKGATDSVKEGYAAVLEQAVIYRDMIEDGVKKQEIRAAFDGVVLEKLIDVNTYILPGTPAFAIGDDSRLELEADILADDTVGMKVGNAIEAEGKVTYDKALAGKIEKIAPAARTVVSALGVNQKRVKVTMELQSGAENLKPGYELDVKILTQSSRNALMVPDTAVFEQNGVSSVFVIENGRAVIRKISKGIEGKDFTEVLEGLSEGTKVLAKPDNDIRAGMRVKEK